MRYKLLGRSGLRVSELALGTMTFGEDWGWGASREESYQIFNRFLEAGGNFIDTSVNYTNGTSEKFLGEFIQPERDRLVIASKYSLSRNWEDPNGGGNSRKNMIISVETSLKRLNTEVIDLYYLHMWDYMTPVEEVMRGLDDLVRAGKIIYTAISDSPAWVISRAQMLAELRGWSPFVGVQIPYSLIDRDVERALLPMAGELGLGVLAWGLLSGGLLTGKYGPNPTKDPKRMSGNQEFGEHTRQVLDTLHSVAQEIGKPMAQVAMNWVRQQQQRAQIIPILGARTAKQLEDGLAILDWQLEPDHLTRLDQASAIELGFPHGFLDGNRYVFGKTFDRIDNHHRWGHR